MNGTLTPFWIGTAIGSVIFLAALVWVIRGALSLRRTVKRRNIEMKQTEKDCDERNRRIESRHDEACATLSALAARKLAKGSA